MEAISEDDIVNQWLFNDPRERVFKGCFHGITGVGAVCSILEGRWTRHYNGVDAMGYSRDFYNEQYPVAMLINGGPLLRDGKWRMK